MTPSQRYCTRKCLLPTLHTSKSLLSMTSLAVPIHVMRATWNLVAEAIFNWLLSWAGGGADAEAAQPVPGRADKVPRPRGSAGALLPRAGQQDARPPAQLHRQGGLPGPAASAVQSHLGMLLCAIWSQNLQKNPTALSCNFSPYTQRRICTIQFTFICISLVQSCSWAKSLSSCQKCR